MYNSNYNRNLMKKNIHAANIRAATQNALIQAAVPNITPSVAQAARANPLADLILKAQQAGSKANMSDITFKRLFGNTREAAKQWWGDLSKAKKFGIGGALGLGAYGLGAFDSPERELTVWEKLGLA